MSDKHPFWNKLTKAIRDSVMDAELADLSVQEAFYKDTKFNFAERLEIVHKLYQNFPGWISKYFSGISNFEHRYITNGNTDALNLVMLEKKFTKIFTLPNEYIYYTHVASLLGLKQQYFTDECLDLIDSSGIVCLSVPASHNGEIESLQKIIDYCQENNISIFIDVAYCGVTDPGHIDIKKTDKTYFAFSFSKTLGLSFNRIGVLYSGEKVNSVTLLNKIGYVNLSAVSAVNKLMEKIPCDYVYKTYKKQYKKICKEHNLTPVKCILFGLTEQDEKFGVAEYYKLL